MKKMLLYLLTILPLFGICQDEKIKIAFTPLKFNASVGQENANSLKEIIQNQFLQTNRFVVVDRSNNDLIDQEKSLQYTSDFIDGEVVEMGKNLGAQYIITGTVLGVSNVRKPYTNYSTGKITYKYNASVSIQLKVIDIVTTEIVASESLYGSGTNVDPGKAMSFALYGGMINGGISKDVGEFIAVHFPVKVQIQEILSTDKKGYASEILLFGGSEIGISEGDKIEIKTISQLEIGGKMVERKTTIAEVKVSDVQDEYFSVGKIKSGGDVLLDKFNAGEELIGYTITNK